MPYVKNHLRLVFSGSLYRTDSFSFGFSMHFGTDGATAPTEVPPALVTAAQAFFQSSPPIISQHAELETIKLNEIGTNGKYVHPTTVLYDYPVPVKGTGGATPAPQIALAVSLMTPIKRGRAHAGRFYMPIPAAEAQSDGLLSPSARGDISRAAVTFLNAINDSVPGWVLSIESDLGAGTWQPVVGIRTGRVFDTIRSRRSAFVEDYYVDPAPVTQGVVMSQATREPPAPRVRSLSTGLD